MITNKEKTLEREDISVSRLRQLQYESDTCKRLLVFMEDENIHLKNRISEILKTGVSESLMNEIDNFQSNFIREDELIRILRNDIVELDKLLVRELFEDGKILKEINRRVKKITHNINNAQEQFTRLKSEFNNFLSENL